MLKFDIPLKVELDPGFIPAVLWNRAYAKLAKANADSRRAAFSLERENGSISRYETLVLPDLPEFKELNLFYTERLLKFLLWSKGGWHVRIAGIPELTSELQKIYSPSGKRHFDWEIMGNKFYRRPFCILACPMEDIPESNEREIKVGGHWEGCRIGFDLGGSDRKCSAVIDGKCVFSEEVAWSPYFEKDWRYHLEGIKDSLKLAAAHLPQVDAIGGSAAGNYSCNQPRYASLFRGISDEDFTNHVLDIFYEASSEFGKVPLMVLNDGEVTALAGALSLNKKCLLGLAMGTSEAIGYINENGFLMDYVNELAFAPIDYSAKAPEDEWTGDIGIGGLYLSQQAIGRIAPAAGLDYGDMPLPEQLKEVQKLMEQNDSRAAMVYRSIGTYLGYAVAHYASFYRMDNLLLLGRVSSGKGGEIIIAEAEKVLNTLFPELKVEFNVPDEKFKRHGQAMIAASLPEIKK